MKKIAVYVLSALSILVVAAVCYAADPVIVPVVTPVVVTPSPSILDWFTANKAMIFGAALAISELLAVTPWFKGNGIMDTIIKALKSLAGKDQAPV